MQLVDTFFSDYCEVCNSSRRQGLQSLESEKHLSSSYIEYIYASGSKTIFPAKQAGAKRDLAPTSI